MSTEGGPHDGMPDFPNLELTLRLLMRAYDELNADLVSAQNRSGVALAAVITAVSGYAALAPSHIESVISNGVALYAFLVSGALGVVAAGLAALWLVRSLRTKRTAMPYDIAKFRDQPSPEYRERQAFLFEQVDAHAIVILDRRALLLEKAGDMDRGMASALVAWLLLASSVCVPLALAVVSRHG